MSILLLFLLSLLALVLLLLKFKRFVFYILILNTTLFAAIGSGLVPLILLKGLQVYPYLANPDWKQKNAIVLLAGGSVRWTNSQHTSSKSLAYPRLYETTRLYFDCKKQSLRCRVVISGGDPTGLKISEADILLHELVKLGAARSDIIIENQSNNTLQNALFTSQILRDGAYDQVILVTSGTHMPRAMQHFAHFGISPQPAPADQLIVSHSWKHLYTNFFITDLALHEYVGRLKSDFSK